jgi:protein-disulfide isomerase
MSRKSQRNRPPLQSQAPGNAPVPQTGRAGRRGILVVAAVLLLALVAGLLLLRSEQSPDAPGGDPARQAALASDHAPTLGDAGARVHIVEFLDPACETCAMFYPLVKRLLAENPGRIRVSIRHVPFHEGADFAVRVLEASRQQDKYWQTLEALFASQAHWAPHHTVRPELVLQAIAGVGLDLGQLQNDMNAPDVTQRMQRDLGDAMALQVTKTPEYFVNGRPLPSFGAQPLLDLVAEELQKSY